MRTKWYLPALTALLVTGCDKDLEETHDDLVGSETGNTIVTMSMAYTHGGAAFDTSLTLTDAMGTAYKISRLRFFISMIGFTDDNGDSVAAFPDQHLLVDMAEGGTIRTIGQLSGHLHEMHMGLGVDSAMNHVDPVTLPPTDPLSDVGMWWGWAVGHLFLTVDGRFDSDQDGIVEATDEALSFHCGMDTLYTPVTIHVHTDADQGGNLIIPLSLDIDMLMASMNIAGTPVVHEVTPVTHALMQKLAAGLSHVE